MTLEELRSLKRGDVVEVLVSGAGLVQAIVACPVFGREDDTIGVRRVGLNRGGKPYQWLGRSADEVFFPARLGSVPANVYADWLDEHDEPRAAAKLRAAFPLADGRAG